MQSMLLSLSCKEQSHGYAGFCHLSLLASVLVGRLGPVSVIATMSVETDLSCASAWSQATFSIDLQGYRALGQFPDVGWRVFANRWCCTNFDAARSPTLTSIISGFKSWEY